MGPSLRLLAAPGAVAILAGCAVGTDFKRPDTQSLVVGKSTAGDVVRVMGAPWQTGEIVRDEQRIETFGDAYAEAAGQPAAPGVTTARAQC